MKREYPRQAGRVEGRCMMPIKEPFAFLDYRTFACFIEGKPAPLEKVAGQLELCYTG